MPAPKGMFSETEPITVTPAPRLRKFQPFRLNKKILTITIVIVAIFLISGGAFAYFKFFPIQQKIPANKTENIKIPEIVLPKEENNVIITSTPTNIPSDDLDYDNDNLTNKLEAFFGTDPNNPDTDGDGFKDGDEILRGFNPKGPGKLKLQSPAVKASDQKY